MFGRRPMATALLLLGSLVAPVEAAAGAPPIACGDVVTEDLVLTNDLVNCAEVGLVIGADDITVDLNGHTIDGALGDAQLGIDNTAGHSGLTVLGGTIRQFVEGVLIAGGERHHVHHLRTVEELHVGVYLADVTDARINRVRSLDSCGGFVVAGGGAVRVDHNTVLGHTCAGVALYSTFRTRVAHNVIDASPDAPLTGDAAGISVLEGSHGTVVRANEVRGNGFVGVHLEGADWNRVVDNEIGGNGIGMILIGDHNLLGSNRVTASHRGCEVNPDDGSCGAGISYEGGSDNLIEGNAVVGSGKVGISVATFAPETPPARDTAVRGNVVRRTAGDGIRVAPGVRRTRVRLNLVAGSGRDGIDVDDPRTSVAGNRAFRNGDLGIEGTPGIDDRGGNRARDNGDPRQCTVVRCR